MWKDSNNADDITAQWTDTRRLPAVPLQPTTGQALRYMAGLAQGTGEGTQLHWTESK